MEVNRTELINMGRDVDAPFDIRISLDGSSEICTIQCLELLRILPGKRIVAKANYNNQSIVLKIFLHNSKKKATQELSGYRLLIEAGIPTPPVVLTGGMSDQVGCVVAYKYILDSNSVLENWYNPLMESECKKDLIKRIMPVMAKLHGNGLIQRDIHLGNFLVTKNHVYIIDAADIIQVLESKRTLWVYLDNLALLFAQFEQKYDDWVEEIFPVYLEGYKIYDEDKLVSAPSENLSFYITEKIVSQRLFRVKQYLKKIFRDSSEFVSDRTFFHYYVYARSGKVWGLSELVHNIEGEFSKGHYIKRGNTAEVVEYQLGDKTLVIKKYRAHRLKYWLRRCWRRGRAWKSWENACRLKMLGVESVSPLALVEKRIGFITLDSYFVSDKINGLNAKEYYNKNELSDKEVEGFYQLFKMLFRARIIHGDMKATNFIIANERPVIIDLDSMHTCKKVLDYCKAFKKELTRFMDNWQHLPEVKRKFNDIVIERFNEHTEVK